MTTTSETTLRKPTYEPWDETADGFELVNDYDIRSHRTFDRAVEECEELERWYPHCEFELRFAWAFSFGRPGVDPGMAPQIQIWTRLKAR